MNNLSVIEDKAIKEDAKEPKSAGRDYWEDDGMVYVTGGLRFGVSATGRTVCMGKIKGAGAGLNTPETSPVAKKAVTKLADEGLLPIKDTQNEKRGVMLHAGGRSKKEGQVTRMTEWRRKKEKQGVLI